MKKLMSLNTVMNKWVHSFIWFWIWQVVVSEARWFHWHLMSHRFSRFFDHVVFSSVSVWSSDDVTCLHVPDMNLENFLLVPTATTGAPSQTGVPAARRQRTCWSGCCQKLQLRLRASQCRGQSPSGGPRSPGLETFVHNKAPRAAWGWAPWPGSERRRWTRPGNATPATASSHEWNCRSSDRSPGTHQQHTQSVWPSTSVNVWHVSTNERRPCLTSWWRSLRSW